MDLKAKLAMLKPPSGAHASAPSEQSHSLHEDMDKAERLQALRAAIAGISARVASDAPVASGETTAVSRPLPGICVETPHGAMHVVDRFLEPHHCHGRVPLASALDVPPEIVATLALDEGLEGFDPRRMLLVDTETTGLAGGTGTIPFLIGMAWFEDESLRVEQLFLRRLGEEAPMLVRVAERLASASAIVTYNGKSFDWPLLRTRFIMNRIAAPDLPPHLDLLHCIRRVYKRRLGQVRLVRMEEDLLGMRREYDIDGSEIPGIYLHFLRGGPEEPLAGVIEHNGNDLVALAALLGEVGRRFRELQHDDDPRDHLGFAQVASRWEDDERAHRFAEAAATGGADHDVEARARFVLARTHRRRGRFADAAIELEKTIDVLKAGGASETEIASAHLALSKLYEHKQKDFSRALEHAAFTAAIEDEHVHANRVARLKRKLESMARRPD